MGKRVAFAGAGVYAGVMFDLLRMTDSTLSAVFDNDLSKIGEQKFGLVIQNTNDVNHHEFDYIVVAAGEWIPIYKQLLSLGCPVEKIVCYSHYLFVRDFLSKYFSGDSPELLITGISYAYDLFFPAIRYCNLAYQAQDIFLDSCISRLFIEKTVGIKALIITCHHYVLEYDMLCSKQKSMMEKYLELPGFTKCAELVSEKHAREIERIKSNDYWNEERNEYNIAACNALFGDFTPVFNISVDDETSFALYANEYSNKNYPHTVACNKKIIEGLVVFCLESGIIPIILTPPQHRIYREHFSKRILYTLLSFLHDMCNKYDLSWINDYEMDFDTYCWYDGHHLNKTGNELYCKPLQEKIQRVIYEGTRGIIK